MPTLLDRIRLAREGAGVERCHTHPRSLRYSVGHHSLDLITLIVLTWQAAHGGALPSRELLVAAAFHDIPEVVVGDVPSTVKDLMGNGRLEAAEVGVLDWLGVGVVLADEELAWLRYCDRLELSLWALEEERHRGNSSFASWVKFDLPLPHPIFLTLGKKKGELFAWKRMTWQELREAGGL